MPRGRRGGKVARLDEPTVAQDQQAVTYVTSDQIPAYHETQVAQDEQAKAVEYIVLQEGDTAANEVVVQQHGEQLVATAVAGAAGSSTGNGSAEAADQQSGSSGMIRVIDPSADIVDPEEMLKTYYTTHSNTLGDSWYICKKCPAFKTSHNSTLRDHINVEHMKIPLKCTHCDFETLRFKTLNSHRKQYHGLGAFQCWMDKCNFKTILTPRMLDHLMKKHNLSREESVSSVETLIAAQPVKQAKHRRKHYGGKAGGGGGGGGGSTPSQPARPRAQRKTDEERQYKIHYNEEGKPACYQCLYCEFTTKMSQNIAGHVNAKHLGRQIKCDECSFSTYYPKNLAVHMKKLHGKTGRHCAVPGCKFRSIHDERMNNHLMEKHGGTYDTEKNTIFVDLNNCN